MKPPDVRTPCEYGPIAFGAFSVMISFFMIESLPSSYTMLTHSRYSST